MFNFSQEYAVHRLFLKADNIRYTPNSLNFANGEINQIFNDIPGENIAFSLEDSFLVRGFIVTHRVDGHARYADCDHIRLVNLCPIAFFNTYRLTSSSGKEIEEICNAHVFCLK